MNYDEDSNIPLSQLANEAFNPVAPRGSQPPPTNFARQLPANGASAGHGPGRPVAPAAPKPPSRHGKLFQVGHRRASVGQKHMHLLGFPSLMIKAV